MERPAARDSGFTLIELLIVIVILGVLSTVTVFAVRGITDRGEESACAGDYATIVRAQESHHAYYGGFADAAALVSADLLASQPTLFDVTGDADGYSVTPAADSGCTQTGGVTPPAPPPVAPPTATPPSGSNAPGTADDVTFVFGVEAWEWWVRIDAGTGKPNDEVVVLGRGEAAAAYTAMEAANPATTRRVTLINIDGITTSEIDDAIHRSRSQGDTAWVLFSGDDTDPVGSYSSVDDYMTSVDLGLLPDPSHPGDEYIVFPPGGDLLALVESYS